MVDGKVGGVCFNEVGGCGLETVWGERETFGKSSELNRIRKIQRYCWSSLKA